jgi:hypothetical protein
MENELCPKLFFHRFELVDQQRMADNPNKYNHNIRFTIKIIKHTADISYANTPNAHQSTALLYPFDKIISGARYSIKWELKKMFIFL